MITLTGTVETWAKKAEAEDAAKKVAGVKAVVEEIKVESSCNCTKKTDDEIASEVLHALKSNWEIPNDKIQVKVEDGWVTLEGELFWNYQKEAAKEAITNLADVKWVSNNITIKSETASTVEKKDVENAFKRDWTLENKNILVSVSNNKVTLNGKVDSWFQKDEASRLAWKAPGIINVDNQLTVEYL